MGIWKKLFAGRLRRVEDTYLDQAAGLSPSQFYEGLSEKLVKAHGALVKVTFVSHFPQFEISFLYEDGSTINSGRRTECIDIHRLALGYSGHGPEWAHVFLRAAGLSLTYDDLISMKPGDSIERRDGGTVVLRDGETVVAREAEGDSSQGLDNDLQIQQFIRACYEGDVLAVRKGLQDGINPSATAMVKWNDNDEPHMESALHQASNPEVLALFLEYADDVNARSPRGWTALGIQSLYGNVECVRLLLTAGADVNAESSTGRDPLGECVCGCQLVEDKQPLYDIAGLLLQAGATPAHRDRALAIAACAQGCERIEAIIKDFCSESVWWLLPKGEPKRGPYSALGLYYALREVSHAGLSIRKGDSGNWYKWVHAAGTYPELAEMRLLDEET